MTRMLVPVLHRADGRPVLVWRPPSPVLAVSTSVLGGGFGTRSWWLNHTVDASYGHNDPAAHLRAIADDLHLDGDGAGMMTAVDVNEHQWAENDGVEVVATVGIGWPTWAASSDGLPNPYGPGTVNLLVWIPSPVSDAALVNALATATEAKAQAIIEAGIPGTGTASDAIVVCCPLQHRERGPQPAEDNFRYGGPRSHWGARAARAVHAAMVLGIARDQEVARATGKSRTVIT